MKFPEHGRDTGNILQDLAARKQQDVDWQSGRAFAYVYDAGPEAMQLLKDSFTLFMTENGLDPTTFPSAMELEKDVMSMAIDLVGGGAEAEGSFTSGGTESLLLSVKTARDYCRTHKPHIKQPELLLPETAHASFFKACAYFDIKPVVAPVNPHTFRADPAAMAERVTENTIMMVASAPSYAHGAVDPIEELGQIALEHELFFHVDCCVGGMYLPFARQLGYRIPRFDLSVPGVTQLSMDFHKWGYAAKGASAIIYKNGAEMRRHQYFAWSGWTGYSVINPTIMSTKSAGPVAACWAILQYMGREGYLDLVECTQSASAKIRAAITEIPQLYLLGEPRTNLFSFASDEVDVFKLAAKMKERGWYIQPQFGFGPSPANIHLSVGAGNATHTDAFIADLRATVAEMAAKAAGPSLQALPEDIHLALKENSPRLLEELSQLIAGNDGDIAGRMDYINNLLNLMPPPVRDGLLSEFVNGLYSKASA
ncbi:pyridoxal phosphate-dependent decarboxylase family protein [Microbulbifer marinus]|uniref:Glutamate or tyrosine decarboxylase n=1 Tax=Microbulbifer marinus TaxID=658218 RepID=A0A1H4A1Z0_9GAMM|nr:aspartate aminotransferase family protein [Microbulbifer marinus]SEA29828.1 Glutamate or tyrosine decarboxylase [Microbulbifer marinus]